MFDAFQDLSDLAETGDPVAQYELAGFYHWGRVGAAEFTKPASGTSGLRSKAIPTPCWALP